MATGIVKFFNRKNNFGFITPDEGGPDVRDVFVHGSNVLGFIKDGDAVEYTMGEGKKGPEAKEVKAIGGQAEGGKVVEMNADEDLDMAA